MYKYSFKLNTVKLNVSKVDVTALFTQGLALHQQGELEKAISIYTKILAVAPEHFDALHLSGVIFAQQMKHQRAADLITRALEVNAKSADAYHNLGNALHYLMSRPCKAPRTRMNARFFDIFGAPNLPRNVMLRVTF